MRMRTFASDTDFFRAKLAAVDRQQGASDLGTRWTPTGKMRLTLDFQAMYNNELGLAQLL